jgi:RHS repeat-associated protein
MSTISQYLRGSMRSIGLRIALVAAFPFAVASHLSADCPTCAASSLALGGEIQLYGKGSCVITVNGSPYATLISNEPLDVFSADPGNLGAFVALADKKFPMGPGTYVEVECKLNPDPLGNEQLSMKWYGKNCVCAGIGGAYSGDIKRYEYWDPVTEQHQYSDPFWESFGVEELTTITKFRVFPDDDSRFDPGSASSPDPLSSDGPGGPDEVPPSPDKVGQTFSLGRHDDVPVGRIAFRGAMDDSITREDFSLDIVEGEEANVEPVVEVGGMPKQFKSSEVLVTLTDLPGSPSAGVKVEIFSAVGAVQELDGSYTPAGDALAVHEISRVSTTVGGVTVQGIRSQATKKGVTSVTEHYSEPAVGGGGVERDYRDGRIVELTRTPTYDGMDLDGYVTATSEKSTGTGGEYVSSEKVQTYHKFPWGMEPVEEEEDPSGAAKTTTYVYYDDVPSTAPHYGTLHVRYSSDGTWERHVYDANGKLTAIHRPWLTSPANAAGVIALPADQCQVTLIEESLNLDGVGSRKTTVEKILGRTISTQITSDSTGLSPLGGQMYESRSESYLGDGTLAQVSRTGFESAGSGGATETGKTLYSVGSDGSTTLYEYSEASPEIGEVLPRHTTIITQGTEAHPHGLPRQHTRSVSISNSDGLIESRTEVALGGEDNYAVVSTQTVEREVDPQIKEMVYQDGVLVSTTTKLSDTVTETVDRAGLVSQTISNATTGEVEATVQKGMSMGHHTGEDLRTDTYKLGLSELILMHNGSSRPSAPSASTADSRRTYDKLGRLTHSSEKLGSRARTYTYTQDGNGVRSEKEWHASVTNPVRVRTYYPSGQLKSVTGEAEIGTYYTYEVEFATGLQVTAVHQGAANSPRWSRTYTDGLGRTIREERPAAGGGGVVTVTHAYNAKGQRTKSVRSGYENAPTLYEYDEAGQMFRQGADLNGNGKLDVLSNEPLTEQLASYEQSGGHWWQVSRSRTYFEDGGSHVRESESRKRLGAGPSQYTQTIQRPGVTTTTTSTVTPSTRTRVTTTARSDATNAAIVTEINGMQVYVKGFEESGTSTSVSTQYFYDALRRPWKVQHPNTTVILTSTYDDYGRVITEKDGTTSSPGTGTVVNNTYDYYPASYGLSEGRLYSKKQIPGGGSGVLPQYTYFSYNAQGQQTHTWGPGTYPMKQVYDSYGQRTQMHTYRATSGSFTGDPAYAAPPTGFSMSTPDITTWAYDAATGLQTSKKDAANEEVLYSYNADGSLHQRTWARGASTTYGYDDLGRLSGLSYSDSTPLVAHTYHRDGTRRTTTDAAGLLTQSLDPATGAASQEAVTTAGSGANLLTGAVVQRSYDARGRLTGLQALNTSSLGPVGPLAPGTTITYGAASGQVSGISSGSHTASYAYSNPLGYPRMVVTRSSSSTNSTDQHHPLLGRRSQSTHGSSWDRQWGINSGSGIKLSEFGTQIWAYGMNARGEITSASRSQELPVGERGELMGVGLEGWTATYSYDALGNRTSMNHGYLSPQGSTVSYTSNALNQYTGLSNSRRLFVLGSADAEATVEVNGVAAEPEPASYNTPVRQAEFFSARLTASGTDAAWVPVTVEASTASPAVSITQTGNRYHPPATETMTYDEDGNLTGDGRWVYTWDAENRLIGMTTQTSAVSAGVPNLRLTFAYDAQHRRIQKKTEIYDAPTTSWVTTTDTRFIYDGWNLLVEVEMHNGAKDAPAGVSGPFVRRSYVWGTDISGTWQGAGGVSGLLAVRRHEHGTKPSALYWTAWDLNGNILGLHNNANGVVASYEYDAFGRLLRESEIEEDLNPFRFSTKYTDAETGLAYYGYRFYDAVRGRWINRDPIEEEGGTNLNAFVANNALSRVDYLGLDFKLEDGKIVVPNCTITLIMGHATGAPGFKFSTCSSGGGAVTCFPRAINKHIPDENEIPDIVFHDYEIREYNPHIIKDKEPAKDYQDYINLRDSNKEGPWEEQVANIAYENAIRGAYKKALEICKMEGTPCGIVAINTYLHSPDSTSPPAFVHNVNCKNKNAKADLDAAIDAWHAAWEVKVPK